MTNIGIIGCGIVGQAVEYGFKDIAKIFLHDKYKPLLSLEDAVRNSEFIFVALPTPSKKDGIDLSIIDEYLEKMTKWTDKTDKIIIIKSSIVPGTARNYAKKYSDSKFCFCPEFLTEANYLEDFVNTDRIVIGADDDAVSRRVIALHRERFPKNQIYQTDLTTAEMVKYMSNCFLAAKVIFANEIHDLCQKLGINYDEVKEMTAADKRIGASHLNITTACGFGGKCFPKDIVALIGLYKKLGVDVSLLETVWNKNLKIRKIRDWEEIPNALLP